ncbi:MAG: 5-formyltetrahydrofolate cyclo-ligase [Armatimonadota bacterium]
MTRPGKVALRREVLERRDSLDDAEHRRMSMAVMDHLKTLPDFQAAQTPLLFASFGSEVDTWPLLEALVQSEVTPLLPAVGEAAGKLHLRAVEDLDADLAPGPWGIMEPTEECRELQISDLDFILVPGVAFDESGRRLGYGGGYYDRLLEAAENCQPAPALAAVAFELQIVPFVPAQPHDRRVPTIVTENRIINCSGNG